MKKSKLAYWCDGLLEAGWLAAVIVTPLFFNIHSSRVFEPDKLTLLRSIAVLMSAAWLVKFVDQMGWRSLNWLDWRDEDSIWRMPLVLPIFLIAIVYLVSTIFSITPNASWAGSYQRLQGTYTTLSYIVIFALMAATIRRRKQVSRIVTTVIVTSIPVALYGMLQHFNLDPLPWGGDVQQRVAGHMGNSIFIAAYLIMVVPLTLARIIDAFTNILQDEDIDTADVVRSSIYIFALAIQFIAIYWSRSRGPFLGLAVSIYAFVLILLVTLRNAQAGERKLGVGDLGKAISLVILGTVIPLLMAALILEPRVSVVASFGLFVGSIGVLVLVIFILALARRGWRWLWLSWILLAVTVAGFLGLFNISDQAAEPYLATPVVGDTLTAMASWRELPEIGRFGKLLESQSGSGRVRVLIWEGVLDLIIPHDPLTTPDGSPDRFNILRPIIGYGPESMYVAYNRFYQPELATIEARNASPDRSHNETFDALAITGVAGLLTWQLLYMSVFYYGFRWLGVVKSSRDRNWLIGLWIGGAVAGGVIITAWLGLPFLGVAVPFGTIAGLVIYLIYYALSSRPGGDDASVDPFGIDRLLMIALLAAVVAHYVEIHFGIAIAATRTHFFVYISLMFLVGYYLPLSLSITNLVGSDQKPNRVRRRRTGSYQSREEGWVSRSLAFGLILALIIGILAFNFMTFSLPSGESIQTIDQVPSPGEIFHQSFLVNTGKGFIDSPFVFVLLVMTWLLGSLLFVSEMVKQNEIGQGVYSSKLVPGRERKAAILLIAVAVGSALLAVGTFFQRSQVDTTILSRMAFWLLLIWTALCLWAAVGLIQRPEYGRWYAGMVGIIGLAFFVPTLVSGSTWVAIVLAVMGVAIMYLLWDEAWKNLLLPAGLLAIVSIGVGILYAYFHAFQIRSSILPPVGVTESTPEIVRRVIETDQAAGILTTFYIFAFLILVFTGLALAWTRLNQAVQWGSLAGSVAAIVLIPLVIYLISTTNLRIIQADIVYKRADPWDRQAGRSGDPALWDNAIAIYEHAIELAPKEDFYYLWLGRAYLERSSVTEDIAEKENLLRIAEDRLKQAQRINPLNTDHTANLARLNTRWAESVEGQERTERIGYATDFYESALTLSPNNSVIINEYARLAFILEGDCEKALDLYDHSLDIDPFYASTYFDRADIYQACGDQLTEEGKLTYYEDAAESMKFGLEKQPNQPRRWLQLADIYIKLGRTDMALAAYNEASTRSSDDTPQWQIDYTMAQWFLEEQDLENAQAFGEKALLSAPDDAVSVIQQFLSVVSSQSSDAGS